MLTMDMNKLLGSKYNGEADKVVAPVEVDKVVASEEYAEEKPVQNIVKPRRGRPRK